MAYFLFVDESGQDHHASPYEVLAGFAIQDKNLWPFITELRQLELDCYGCRYSDGADEIKAKKLLKRKTFKLASLKPPFSPDDRRRLSALCLSNGDSANVDQYTALSQAKLLFINRLLELCRRYDCKFFASIVADHVPAFDRSFLRKDYSYLFERFYSFLEDVGGDECGIIVFDELEKTQSHLLVEQMSLYFNHTRIGIQRSKLIVPEPMFVHSDLTTGVQLADICAYLLSWGFRTGILTKPRRTELDPFVRQLKAMRYDAVRSFPNASSFTIYGFGIIQDLLTREQRLGLAGHSFEQPRTLVIKLSK